MSILPVVERELRAAARQPKTHRDRWLVVLGLLALSCFIFLVEPSARTRPALLGQTIFNVCSVVLMIAALCTGFNTADALSREKREGTLGLLFLTDLKGYDIVLGKWFSHTLSSTYAIFAAFPMLALPVLMGGVDFTTLACTLIGIVNGIFYGSAAGLMISALSISQRKAVVATGGFVSLLVFGLPALDELFQLLVRAATAVTTPLPERVTSYLGPLMAYMEMLEYRAAGAFYWKSQAATHGLAWLFLIIACLTLPHRWKQSPPDLRRQRWIERLRRWSLGEATARKALRTRLLATNPVCWLDDRYRLQKSLLWAVMLGIITAWMWGLTLNDGYVVLPVVVFTGLLIKAGFIIWLASEGSHRFSEDRHSGAMELLLATPLTAEEILADRWRAMRRQFGWPIAAAGGLFTLLVLMTAASGPARSGFVPKEYGVLLLAMWILGLVSLLNILWCTTWLALWQGMVSRTWGIAVLMTVARAGALPFACFLAFMGTLAASGYNPGNHNIALVAMIAWLGSGLLVALPQALVARRKLRKEFRERASRSVAHRVPGLVERVLVRWGKRSRLSGKAN